MRREKGSITIFSLISLLLITAAIFALLEGTRLQEMRRIADLQTESALESVFANYNSCLWQNYRLLGANQGQMNEILEKTANARIGSGTNFLQLRPKEIEVESYTLLTDGTGDVFIGSVSSYMRENFLYESAKEIYNQYEAVKNLMDESQMDLSNIGEALNELENVDLTEGPNSFGTSGTQEAEDCIDVASILEVAKSWQEFGILELVLNDTEQISREEQDFSNGLLERTIECGKNSIVQSTNWGDRILLQQYLLTYLSNFGDVQSNRALSYELEYLLGAKSSDVENLKVAVNKILAVREAANFLYLISDSVKVAKAEGLATMMAGASLNPAIINVVKIGILTAWAFAESILDVRALLVGKRIALIKSAESWTTELENLSLITGEFEMAEESSWGLTYENYLGVLLLFEKEQNLAMRAMNIQEATIRKTYQDASFQMDALIVQANAKIVYSYEPVFPFLRIIDAQERWEYRVSTNENYGYY